MNMRKIQLGILLGIITGTIDIVPMILQNLTWDANLSALSLWIVAGFFISTSDLELNSVLKGILISFLCLLPSAFIIGWNEPTVLIPIIIMTLILGGILGYSVDKLTSRSVK